VYLTVKQVLADLGTFINTISIEQNQLLDRPKWVGFGSSYSGSLVTWLRLKYPHLVHAAVSSSSPQEVKINFEGIQYNRYSYNYYIRLRCLQLYLIALIKKALIF